ncbi:TM2 domain-containing protein [Sutterella sp.]|uniref:TM2 domain-containing protein n=1 Tax=Sutterella sp. TaxID=1981025 RepID=UPI0026DF4909|nr:TM2 domain-containing protein [Sutterella sp.]MDO5532601.1 TM2 domain-containing protein [Sutterella sp.]
MQLIETRVSNEKKSSLTAYALWFFLGYLGVHHFYLGRTKTGLFYLVGGIIGWICVGFGVLAMGADNGHSDASAGGLFAAALGGILVILIGIGLIIDLFRIPGYIDKHRTALREKLTQTFLATGHF